MASPNCCLPGSPLSTLLCPELSHALAASETLKSPTEEIKQQIAEEIRHSPEKNDYVCRLGHLLRSADSRRSSAAAFLLGVLVEAEGMVTELQAVETSQDGDGGLVEALVCLLTREEPGTVVHAAEAMASLVDTSAGRRWLLRHQAVFHQAVVGVLTLLEGGAEDLVNLAVLILARLSLCEVACQALLHHPSAYATLGMLIECLAQGHADTSTKAAFAVGRLCGCEGGRSLILAVAEARQLVASLEAMLSLCCGPEAVQAACFALSCLATEEDGHRLVLGSPSFHRLLDCLLHLLESEDQDTAWFAARAVKVFVTRPTGVIQVREHKLLESQLKTLSCSPAIGQELREEVIGCLRKLERLAQPSPPTTRLLPSGSCIVSWDQCTPESGLEVTYSLWDNDTVLYQGPRCSVILPSSNLHPRQQPSFRLIHSTSDGDTSPSSQPVLLVRPPEGGGTIPGPPRELRVIGCTTTQVRLGWLAPAGKIKPKAYQLHREGRLLVTTTKLGAIVGGLSQGSQYRLAVCAVGPGNEPGPCAYVDFRTAEGRDHGPSGLTVVVRGRHELHVQWGAPLAPLGRLFNYELRLNGHVVYLGTECSHTACCLAANTAYTCTVAAITTRGRCQSQPVTKRTARDEYLHTPSRQAVQRTSPLLIEVPEMSKVKGKPKQVKGAFSPDTPKAHTSGRRHTATECFRGRRRKPLIPTPPPHHNNNKVELPKELPKDLTDINRLIKQQSEDKLHTDVCRRWSTASGTRHRGKQPERQPANVVALRSVELITPVDLSWKGSNEGGRPCLKSQERG